MSRQKKQGPAELRAELARARISRKEVAAALRLSYDYIIRILSGTRDAAARRAQIHEYILGKARGKELSTLARKTPSDVLLEVQSPVKQVDKCIFCLGALNSRMAFSHKL